MHFPSPRQLLPHSGRAVLIDAILERTDDAIVAEACITHAHPYFVAEHGVPAWVGIEMMAQAIASYSGLGAQGEQKRPRQGMLLGTRRYAAETPWFSDGMRLVIRAKREFGGAGGMAACECTIESKGTLLAEATLIMVEEDIDE